jgi:hypothetical protein
MILGKILDFAPHPDIGFSPNSGSGSLLTLCWRKTDSNSWSHRERNGCERARGSHLGLGPDLNWFRFSCRRPGWPASSRALCRSGTGGSNPVRSKDAAARQARRGLHSGQHVIEPIVILGESPTQHTEPLVYLGDRCRCQPARPLRAIHPAHDQSGPLQHLQVPRDRGLSSFAAAMLLPDYTNRDISQEYDRPEGLTVRS